MDSNPYAFNRDASYPAHAGFPRNVARKDLLEVHIQVVIPEKADSSSRGRGDFIAELEDIFAKYRLPQISSETVMGLWQRDPMGSGRIRWISLYGVLRQAVGSLGVTTSTSICPLPQQYFGSTCTTRCAGSLTSHGASTTRQSLGPAAEPVSPPCIRATLSWIWCRPVDRLAPKRLQERRFGDRLQVQSW